MSKAQEKRDKQLREGLQRRLTVELADFKNTYLNDFATYRFNELSNELDYYYNLVNNPKALEDYNNLKKKSKWFTPSTAESFKHTIKKLERKLSLEHINQFNWLTEANDNYTKKFNNLVEKLVTYKIDIYKLKVERVSNQVNISFLISDNNIEVEARLIYANGEVNAPHYRFITTKRNK